MPCVAVFGRGSMGGELGNRHLQEIKKDPDILAAIYTVAGITPFVPVSMGWYNFRFGRNVAERSFVCPEPTCCRHLPVHVSQLDHNVPQAKLALPAFSQAHLGQPIVSPRNFAHRPATDSLQHTNHVYQPGGLIAPAFDFAIYYTFRTNVFNLVMESGGLMWHLRFLCIQAPSLFSLIQRGFTLAPNGPDYNVINTVGALSGKLVRTLDSYRKVPTSDLSNYQFLCGPCNATKNASGTPIIQNLNY